VSSAHDQLHAMGHQVYAYLQLGQDQTAEALTMFNAAASAFDAIDAFQSPTRVKYATA
jgi:hypothetical protein